MEQVADEARYADDYVYEVISPKYRVASNLDDMIIDTIVSSMQLRSETYSGKTMHTVIIVCPEKGCLSDDVLTKLKMQCRIANRKNQKIRWDFLIAEDDGYNTSISEFSIAEYNSISELEQWREILRDVATDFRYGSIVA